MSHPLVGLVGYARSGKDTVANALCENLGYVKASMADPLREMAAAINPVVGWGHAFGYGVGGPVYYRPAVESLGYEAAKDRYPELRRFLQRLGTEGIRDHVGADYWVRAAERRIQTADHPLVFSDIRFQNEAEMILRNGGVIVYVNRPSVAPVGDVHASEQLPVVRGGWILDNSGDLAHLADAIVSLTEHLDHVALSTTE